MRILHLFANYKWTGPADPAMRAAVHLRKAGHDVVFAQAGWTLPDAEHRMAKELRRARLPVITGLSLRKHFHVPSLMRDARALRARLDAGEFDVVHTHLLADHLVAAMAKRRARRRPVLVRSFYEPEAPRSTSWRHRVALRYTDGVVAPTPVCAQQFRERFGWSESRTLMTSPPTETDRLRMVGDLRERLGVGAEHFVVGITARIQPHRRFELLWEALRLVADARPQVRLVLLGRGNARDTEEHVRQPVRELGLEEQVVLPGYLYEPDYSLALRSLDAFAFMVPGSDGTCRALREAMALGLPVVTTRRGILPEYVAPLTPGGTACGIACDETPASLATALIGLCDDEARRRALGAAALERVQTTMDPTRAAADLYAFYQALRDRP